MTRRAETVFFYVSLVFAITGSVGIILAAFATRDGILWWF